MPINVWDYLREYDELRDETSPQAVPARRVRAVTVRSETSGDIESRMPTGNLVEDGGAHNGGADPAAN